MSILLESTEKAVEPQNHNNNRVAKRTPSNRRTAGLLHWAQCAIEELDHVGCDLEADPVHDLRVAIRRCRSIAEGLRSIYPSKQWKHFRALPKPLFAALGTLRDTQVMREWLATVADASNPLRTELDEILLSNEVEQKRMALFALNDFNAKRWLRLAEELDGEPRRAPLGSFEYIALERWLQAKRSHEIGTRTHNDIDLHQARIGIKRFRYSVENFLPQLHKLWSRELKRLQDLLGDVHDLDVLRNQIAPLPESRNAKNAINARISAEREKRIAEYESLTIGPDSLWDKWREGLPSGRDLTVAFNAKVRLWCRTLDPHPQQARRVAQMSGRLWNGLQRKLGWTSDRHAAALLRTASMFCNVGAAKNKKKKNRVGRQNSLLSKFSVPVGWSQRDMSVVRLATLFAQSQLPIGVDEEFSQMPPSDQQKVIRFAGIVRLARALVEDTQTATATIGKNEGIISVVAQGLDPLGPAALHLAAARHLLEVSLQRPILVSSAPSADALPPATPAHPWRIGQPRTAASTR